MTVFSVASRMYKKAVWTVVHTLARHFFPKLIQRLFCQVSNQLKKLTSNEKSPQKRKIQGKVEMGNPENPYF